MEQKPKRYYYVLQIDPYTDAERKEKKSKKMLYMYAGIAIPETYTLNHVQKFLWKNYDMFYYGDIVKVIKRFDNYIDYMKFLLSGRYPIIDLLLMNINWKDKKLELARPPNKKMIENAEKSNQLKLKAIYKDIF